jgi:hypothetical protein
MLCVCALNIWNLVSYCIACVCSLYIVLKFLPVCPIYFSVHSLSFNWYVPLLLYVSMSCFLGLRWFCIVFFLLCMLFVCRCF